MLAGALKEIQTRIPDLVRLYTLGSTPAALVSAVNLDKKLEESSPGRPEISHSKSFSGTKKRSFFIISMKLQFLSQLNTAIISKVTQEQTNLTRLDYVSV